MPPEQKGGTRWFKYYFFFSSCIQSGPSIAVTPSVNLPIRVSGISSPSCSSPIIDAFENYNIAQNIKNQSGVFLYLSDLISKTLSESSWNLTRNARQALPKLKDIGDKSAHSRRFNAIRNYGGGILS